MEELSKIIISIIREIPEGKVSSYGRIAAQAGMPRGARQVARLLHSSSRRYGLPWQRVVAADGSLSLSGEAGELQRALLESEGVRFTASGKVNMKHHLWAP